MKEPVSKSVWGCERVRLVRVQMVPRHRARPRGGGGLTQHSIGGVWHKASVSDCLPLAAPIGLSPLLILTLCGAERVLVVSTEPPDELSCLTTSGVGRPGDRLLGRGGGACHHQRPRRAAPCGWMTSRVSEGRQPTGHT